MGEWALVDPLEEWVTGEWAWVCLAVLTEGWVVMEALVGVLVDDMDVDMVDASEDMVA